MSYTNRFGSEGNKTSFDAITGDMSMSGSATTWEDLRVEPTVRGTSSHNPSFEKYLDSSGLTLGLYLYSFPNESTSNENEVFFSMQMPHNWASTAIYLHVHWIGNLPDTTAAPRWGLEYSWANIGEVYSGTTFIYTDGVNYDANGNDVNIVANKHYISKFLPVTPTNNQDGLSSILIGRCFRNSGAAADTYDAVGSKCGLLYVDAHYEINDLGSNQEYVK
jgi:hypothetical protein